MAGVIAFILQAIVLVATGLCCTAKTGRSLLSETDHKYNRGDEVKIFANKVGPFHNPRYDLYRAT